ncbi:Fpg/Nei family DNA glycosylase [Nocardioides aurantiacus]|uniref:DNA-(apurinic or apyrimidinic site) lyase n=1 Tax=Nocardioides aurantiacus TaxID=86796 RepID=A0A3N2CVU5_9ACTN|nr:DNA-formamidopyrimidine glycosylase family protein [Nocardioides aurantiacus]ROR91675.1 endonuclease-8 [Nocardioides aurantiacus]
MPEGHTLFRLATSLRDAFAGDVVASGSPQGRFQDSAEQLDGLTLLGASSRGKHLFVDFEQDRAVHVHLGLYGKFVVRAVPEPGPAPDPVGQVRWRLVSGSAYADLRGATACELVTPEARQGILDRLGPDPLDPGADPERAWARISRSRAPIGGLLMDQAVVAGVGNVYRAEVLFRHRLHPLRPGRTLRRGQFAALWEDLVVLLHDGVRAGQIRTLRPEHAAVAREASKVERRRVKNYVYRRQGQPCLVCGATVRTEELQHRNSFWCPRCQPVFRSRAVG